MKTIKEELVWEALSKTGDPDTYHALLFQLISENKKLTNKEKKYLRDYVYQGRELNYYFIEMVCEDIFLTAASQTKSEEEYCALIPKLLAKDDRLSYKEKKYIEIYFHPREPLPLLSRCNLIKNVFEKVQSKNLQIIELQKGDDLDKNVSHMRNIVTEDEQLNYSEKKDILYMYQKIYKSDLRLSPIGKMPCFYCKHDKKYEFYCCICIARKLGSEKLVMGNKALDYIIRQAQMKTPMPYHIIEWIPYNRFINVQYLDKGGFGKVYEGVWIDGPIEDWNSDYQGFVRNRKMKVTLKSLEKSPVDFFKDVCIVYPLMFRKIWNFNSFSTIVSSKYLLYA